MSTLGPDPASRASQSAALLEEYRCMYGLALFRLEALDRRVPAAGATLAAFIGTVAALPLLSRELVLVAVPLATTWWLRVTINHARSFEDAVRRIETVERRLNAHLDADVLGFQSKHPSRYAVGGRTGRETVDAVLVASVMMTAGCAYLFAPDHTASVARTFVVYAGSVSLRLVWLASRLLKYRYQPQVEFTGR